MRISKRIVALTLILALVFGSVPTTLAADELPAADTPVSSDAPADQPEAPADQPEAPAEQPEASADQPEAPADQPEAPADQPEAPADQPEAPADQPETPADQPETPADQPDAPADQPEAPAEQPETPSDAAAAPADLAAAPAPASVDPADPIDPIDPVDPVDLADDEVKVVVWYEMENIEDEGYTLYNAENYGDDYTTEVFNLSALGVVRNDQSLIDWNSNDPDKYFTRQQMPGTLSLSKDAAAQLESDINSAASQESYYQELYDAKVAPARLPGFAFAGAEVKTLDDGTKVFTLTYKRIRFPVYIRYYENELDYNAFMQENEVVKSYQGNKFSEWFWSSANQERRCFDPDILCIERGVPQEDAFKQSYKLQYVDYKFGQQISYPSLDNEEINGLLGENAPKAAQLQSYDLCDFWACFPSHFCTDSVGSKTIYQFDGCLTEGEIEPIQNIWMSSPEIYPQARVVIAFFSYYKKAPLTYTVNYQIKDANGTTTAADGSVFEAGTVPNLTYTTLGGRPLDEWLQLEYPNMDASARWQSFYNRTEGTDIGALSNEIKNPNLADGYTLVGISNIDDKAQTITLQIDREVKVTVEYNMENVNDDGYTLYNAEGSDDYAAEVFDLTALAPFDDEKLAFLNRANPNNLVTRATMPRELALGSSVVEELKYDLKENTENDGDFLALRNAGVAPIRLPGFAFDHAEQTTDEATGNVTFTLTYKRLRFPYYLRYYPSKSVWQTQWNADIKTLENFADKHITDIFKTGSIFKVDINAWSLERYLPADFDTDGYKLMYKEYKFGQTLDSISAISDINAMLEEVNSAHPLLETYDNASAHWSVQCFANGDDGYTSERERKELIDLMESGQLPRDTMPCGLFMRCYYKNDPLNYTVQYVVTGEDGKDQILEQGNLTLPDVLKEQLEAQASLTYTTLGGKTLGRWIEKNLYPNAPDNTARWQMFFDRTEIGGLASTQPGDEARAALREVTYQDNQGFTYAVTGIVSIDDTQKIITLRMEKTFGNLQINVNWHHLQGSPTVFFKVTGATDTFSMVVPVSVPSGAASGEQSNTGSSIIYYLPCGSYTVEPVGDWYWNYTLTGTGQNTVAVTNQTTQTISFDAPYRQTPWYNWETYSKSEKVLSALG